MGNKAPALGRTYPWDPTMTADNGDVCGAPKPPEGAPSWKRAHDPAQVMSRAGRQPGLFVREDTTAWSAASSARTSPK